MAVPYTLITSALDLGAVADEISKSEEVSLDIETTSLDPRLGKIRLVQIETRSGIYVIDMFQTGTLGAVAEALNNASGETGPGRPVIIGQNLKFEQRWLYHHHKIHLWPVFDTYRASRLIHNGRNKAHDLNSIYQRELDYESDLKNAHLGASDWSGPLEQRQLDYAAEDVAFMSRLRAVLKPKLAELRLNRTALIEFRAILPESKIENNGFFLDREAWTALSAKNLKEMQWRRFELLKELPHPEGQLGLFDTVAFNLDSPEQILKSLSRMNVHLPDSKKTTMAMFAAENPIVNRILSYREVAKSLSSFGDKFLKHIHPITGRVHTEYFPFTGAGRYASSKPNLQQIPRKKAFRECFRAEDGNVLIFADYSQIELRLAAQASGDPTLLRIFREGLDPHIMTASLISGTPYDQITKDQRQLGKPINFGLIYGLMPKKLVLYARANYGVSMTERQAQMFWDRYFEAYPGMRRWQLERWAIDKPRGYSRTMGGRLRYLESATEHNSFSNTPIQGGGADGLKIALACVERRLRKYGDDVRMVHMVHDEIGLEAKNDKDLVTEAKIDLQQGMIEGMQQILTSCPVEADAKVGATWAAAK